MLAVEERTDRGAEIDQRDIFEGLHFLRHCDIVGDVLECCERGYRYTKKRE